jgi:hypothetical protein
VSRLKSENQKIILCSSVTCDSIKILYGMESESNSENGSEPIVTFLLSPEINGLMPIGRVSIQASAITR